ncbi:MAG: DUF4416 family protein [Deltaproteobacteria bacterium]|nr:DUF4416 family protein [Deltaproteobacteria bacterium]
MSILKTPASAKLIIGFFLNDKSIAEHIINRLQNLFGDIDIISSWFNFDRTNYYETEMGSPLFRRIAVFKKLIKQTDLADIKLATNNLEKEETDSDKRRVNIDPGYMLAERFVLATGKNFSHRIYIGKKVYADLTLIYKKNNFSFLPWTYPDYKSRQLVDFLSIVRKKYMLDLKKHNEKAGYFIS